jgi:hypothetical protein
MVAGFAVPDDYAPEIIIDFYRVFGKLETVGKPDKRKFPLCRDLLKSFHSLFSCNV